MDKKATVRRSERVVSRDMVGDQGAMLLHLDTDAYYTLNRLGTVIWHEIGEPVRLAELLHRIRDQVPEAPPSLEEDVKGFLVELADRGVILVER